MKRVPLLMVVASVLAGLGIVQMTFLIGHALYRNAQWNQEIRSERAAVITLRRDINVLDTVGDRVNDPAYLAELARCQGFVGGREKVVVDEKAVAPKQGNCEPVQLP